MSLVLVCNSHIDPVWLWPWEEGVAATLSTFRAAADLCEEFDGFVFCHDGALFYAWVEEFEPALFARIRRLVGERRWHVMGGWYLSPDCNLPSGESLVRQILIGKRYFREKFDVEPTVAVNLDPFGHCRGLVQILAKSGYDGYLFCRPDSRWLPLADDDFLWVGHDGSTIVAHRAGEHYNSALGKAGARVERWIAAHPDREPGLLLWGVGNHGGGPSRQDLRAIAGLQQHGSRPAIVHGRPEDYFAQLAGTGRALPRHSADLNPWAVGCYTSMAPVKEGHARLERELFAAEAMAASAAVQGLLAYPREALRAALEDLLFCQFHDVLPGEGVREVERQALERLGHGLTLAGRIKTRAFFANLAGAPPAEEGEYPIFVHNHHAFDVDGLVECEFQPPEPNPDRRTFWEPELRGPDGARVPVQLEKESCNIQQDHRKRVVFRAHLPASTTTRYACRLVARPREADPPLRSPSDARGLSVTDRCLVHRSDRAEVEIDRATGLLAAYRVDGVEYLSAPAFDPLVVRDTADPWGMQVRAFRDVVAHFGPLPSEEAAVFCGVSRLLPAVRVIESGKVRTIVEAVLGFGRSALALRYKLPSVGAEIEVEVLVSWFERDRMLKLAVPTRLRGRVLRQTAYGVDPSVRAGEEEVWHRWMAVTDADDRFALSLVNDRVYGFDAVHGEVRISLLRAPAYAGHPIDEATPIVRQDRFEPREDQGLHAFRFWLNAGDARTRLDLVGREAAARTSAPMALNAFPEGGGTRPLPGVRLEDAVVQTGCVKLSEDGRRLLVRLFEPTGTPRTTTLLVPGLDVACAVSLAAFEIATVAIDLETRRVERTDLLERAVPPSSQGVRL